VQRST
jgi:hypothetical protein